MVDPLSLCTMTDNKHNDSRQNLKPCKNKPFALTGLISLNKNKAIKNHLPAPGLFVWYLKSTYQTVSNLEVKPKSLNGESTTMWYLDSHMV